ncbi:MOSC domain-containing protein [Pedococcus sp. P5_B7]
MADETTHPLVLLVTRYPVKSMGGEALASVEVGPTGVVGDREWAVYAADGKLASGKHSRRFRRMDPVFELVAAKRAADTVVTLPDGSEVALGRDGADSIVSRHFGEPVTVRREGDVQHQDAATFSIVGSATLAELGRHEGDGRPLDPRHLRVNVVVRTDQPYAEESWIGRDVTIGTVRLRVTEAIERCRMVGVAQVGLPERPRMLQAISDHHDLHAGIYATVEQPGTIAVGDLVRFP